MNGCMFAKNIQKVDKSQKDIKNTSEKKCAIASHVIWCLALVSEK